MTYDEQVTLAAEGQVFLIMEECETPEEFAEAIAFGLDEYAWNASKLVRSKMTTDELAAGVKSDLQEDEEVDSVVKVHYAVVDDVRQALIDQVIKFADELDDRKDEAKAAESEDSRGYI